MKSLVETPQALHRVAEYILAPGWTPTTDDELVDFFELGLREAVA
jgi:hypothetical protein